MAELLRDLSRSECEALMRRGVVGRVALATPTGPHIVPVNYTLSRGDVVVATSPYSVLGSGGRDTVLAFEVDHVEHAQQRGWSVVVRGRAEAVEDPEEVRTLGRMLPQPWASGNRALYLRIPLTEVTGRRLGDGWDLEGTMPPRQAM